jgi:hypothetical protein
MVCFAIVGVQDVWAFGWVFKVSKYLQNLSHDSVWYVSGLSIFYVCNDMSWAY